MQRYALSHGDKNGVIKIITSNTSGFFELSVINKGRPIPQERIANLFQPYVRGEEKNGSEGLGLGLYICAEIAKAHGGKLEVKSDELETCFNIIILHFRQ